MRTRTLSIASLFLVACTAAHSGESLPEAPAAGGRATSYGHFPAPRGSLQLGPQDTLLDLLGAWEEVTGLTFSTDKRTHGQLEVTELGIDREVTVPPESVYAWAGGLLLQHGFLMSDLTGTDPRLVGVYSPDQSAPLAIDVPVEQLGEFALHPALMIQTALQLEHVDVRTLGNSLRGLTSDGSVRQGVIPVGNTNTVLLQGTVRMVTDLVETLQRINAEEGAKRSASKG